MVKATKKLIIVCDEKTEQYANYLRQLISTNDDKDGEVVGIADGTVEAAVWLEKEYLANKAQISSNEHILFIGDNKTSKSESSSMVVKFEKYGMQYGWLGKRAMMKVDNEMLEPESYDEFIEYALGYQSDFEKIAMKRAKTKAKPFLGRKIWKDTINSISRDENKWSAGYFVKPAVRSKAFTGKTISSIKDLMGCGNHAEDYEVLVSESLDIAAEWRCFITYDEIIDVRPYGMIIDKSRKGYLYHYDAQVLNSMMESFVSWEDRPMACSMDICVTKDGRTLLVEFNDAYSLGAYGLADIYYAKLISARWSQLLGVKDEYHF